MPTVLSGAAFSTYRIGGPIDEAYQPQSFDEAVALLKHWAPVIASGQKPLTVLGWGGNTLIASAGIRGMTLLTRKLDFVEPLLSEPLAETRFRFGAGVHLAKVAKVAVDHHLSGGEFNIGIPGTVGGAIRMNAGAMGQETADVLESAEIFNLETAELEHWSAQRLAFSYRKSALKPGLHVVLAATYRFVVPSAETIPQIQARMNDNVAFRKTHHPTEPNGGSVFKNPPGHKAGELLDRLGAKTWHEGDVQISPLHANFIVNHGQGSSIDVLRLMHRCQQAVEAAYGIRLRPENVFVGQATPEEAQLWRELTA